MKKREIEKKASSSYLQELNTNEGDDKVKAINSVLKNNLDKIKATILQDGKEVDTGKLNIFYLASSHKDCAKDHKEYQGKMYIDENWTKIEMPYGVRNAIIYYINTHNVKTIQWVMGKPAWFITRPNCRHYFKELSVKDVLATSRTKLIEKYNLKTAIGDREYLQTIDHAKNKEWYDDVRNAQLLVGAYKERLDLHKQMYKQHPLDILASAIKKDKMLINKWQEYIKEKGV